MDGPQRKSSPARVGLDQGHRQSRKRSGHKGPNCRLYCTYEVTEHERRIKTVENQETSHE